LAAGPPIDSGATKISLEALEGMRRVPITVLPSGDTEVGSSICSSLAIVEVGPLRSSVFGMGAAAS
jgi:hypothetical protein